MKKLTLILMLFVAALAGTDVSAQGLSINGQDTKKQGAVLATVQQAGRLYFHAEAIPGVVYYDLLPEAEFKRNIKVFSEIGKQGIIGEMNMINEYTKGTLKKGGSGAINLDAKDAETIWNSGKVIRMSLDELKGKYSFVSVDNALNGDINQTVPRSIIQNEEFFVLDLRAEGYGLFILASALCCNPPFETSFVFALQKKDPRKKEEGTDAPNFTPDQELAMQEHKKALKDMTEKYQASNPGSPIIINAPLMFTGNQTVGNVDISTPSGSGYPVYGNGGSETVQKVRKAYYEADDETDGGVNETYTTRTTTQRVSPGGSSNYTTTSCNGCGSSYPVNRNGRPKSTGADIATAVFTGAHLAYDMATDIWGPGGRWNYNANRGTTNVFNTIIRGGNNGGGGNGGGGNNGGSGEMGYGVPPM